VTGSAVFSEDRLYRYVLWRHWSMTGLADGGRFVAFVGLNPSTADETTDDPTIRKCRGFAERWGFARMAMVNLFALRATDPRVMKKHPEPVGPENDIHLVNIAINCDLLVFAWGKDGRHRGRDREVVALLHSASARALRLNGDGSPAHPLYQPYSRELVPFVEPKP
jgi:hypothetical protein